MELAAPDLRLEHAVLRATPASPWSTQSCVPHRQSCRWLASGLPPFKPIRPSMWGRHSCTQPTFVGEALVVGQPFQSAAGFRAGLGPLYPLPSSTQSLPPWSRPPGLPHRPFRGARSLACHTGSHAGGRLVRLSHPYSGGRALMCGGLSLWGRTVIARLRKFAALISEDSRESCGKSRSRHYRTETFNQRQCGQCMSNAARANSRLRTH